MASTTEIAGIALWDPVLRLFYHLVPRPKRKVLGIIYGNSQIRNRVIEWFDLHLVMLRLSPIVPRLILGYRVSRYVHAFLTPSHDPIMYCAINDRGHLTIRLLTRDVTASIGYHFETQKSYVKREKKKKKKENRVDNVVCYRRKIC